MISALQSALLCAELYSRTPDFQPGHYWQFGGVIVAHKRLGEDDTLTFRGSQSTFDWLRNAEGWPWWDAEIGFCHAGFLRNMDAVIAEVMGVLKGPVTIQGHSLGAARARICAAKMLVRGMKVARLCVFGCPKPGFANIGRIFDKAGLDRSSWRNRNDPVPLVPGMLPEWAHTEPWDVFDEAAPADDLSPLRDHGMVHYIAGARRLEQLPPALPVADAA